MFRRWRASLVYIAGIVILGSTTIEAQEHSIKGEVLDGKKGVAGVMVTVVVEGKNYNSQLTQADGRYVVKFPDADRISKIEYEPSGSAYYLTTIKDASGRRDHQISIFLRETSKPLSAADATNFYQEAMANLRTSAFSPERMQKYFALINNIRIDPESISDYSDYYLVQMKHTEVRKAFRLEQRLLLDPRGRALEPPDMIARPNPMHKTPSPVEPG